MASNINLVNLMNINVVSQHTAKRNIAENLYTYKNKHLEVKRKIQRLSYFYQERLSFLKEKSSDIMFPLSHAIIPDFSDLNAIYAMPKIAVASHINSSINGNCLISFKLFSPIDVKNLKYNSFELDILYNEFKHFFNVSLYGQLNGDLELFSFLGRLDFSKHKDEKDLHFHLPDSRDIVKEVTTKSGRSKIINSVRHCDPYSIICQQAMRNSYIPLETILMFVSEKFNIANLNINSLNLFNGLNKYGLPNNFEELICDKKFQDYCNKTLDNNKYDLIISKKVDIGLIEKCLHKTTCRKI